MAGMALGFGELLTVQYHARAEQSGLLHFVEGRVDGHDDGRRNAEPRCVMGYALRMVTGRHGDHAAASLIGIEPRQLAERTAFLERSRELLVLELEVDLGSGDSRQRLRAQAGCANDLPLQQGCRRANPFDGHRHDKMIPVQPAYNRVKSLAKISP